MILVFTLLGFLSDPGRMMGPPQGAGSGAAPPANPYAIVTEDDQPLTTEANEVLETEDAP